ncbi:hypothetical protein [Candidatus Hodarchaeum mangrovi]
MSGKNLRVVCIWKTDEFIVSESQSAPPREEASLVIDEEKEIINVNIPSNYSLVTKKIIERRANSITKTGFALPKTNIRIGTGFTIEITKEDTIPSVLLQEGHKYSYDIFGPPGKQTEEEGEKHPSKIFPVAEEEEYVPSFLKHAVDQPNALKTISKLSDEIETEVVNIVETASTSAKLEDPDQLNDEIIAGRFVIELVKLGDVYIKKEKSQYSVEYSAGRVDFTIKDGKIDIFRTDRVSLDDPTLKQALMVAHKE